MPPPSVTNIPLRAASTIASSSSSSSSSSRPPLSAVLPPLVLGTATFNHQYHPNPDLDLSLPILRHAFARGITAIDTSPYYGPSELLLGAALRTLTLTNDLPPRDDLFLITKAGRIGPSTFDYTPSHISHSVRRSLARLGTSHLDLVHCHDVEFLPPSSVLAAVRELRRLRDREGLLRYVGISGYPPSVLADLASYILRETGEPLDAVQSYSHFCVQNDSLADGVLLDRFRAAHVGVVTNASMLSMGLLTTRGANAGPQASWHPAPRALRLACRDLAGVAAAKGEKLEDVALRWAMANWASRGAEFGSSFVGSNSKKVGVSVMGVTHPVELEETYRAWRDVLREGELRGPGSNTNAQEASLSHQDREVLARADKIQRLVEEEMRPALGEWRNHSWSSPQPGFVNERRAFGVLPEDHDDLPFVSDGAGAVREEAREVLQPIAADVVATPAPAAITGAA